MTLDATLRPLANNLLAKFGKSSTITRTSDGSYDPVTGTTTGATTTDYPVFCSPPERFTQSLVDGVNVLRTDIQTLIAAQALTIRPTPATDTVTFDGVVYTLLDAAPIYSGEQVAYYTLHLRV